MKKACIGFAVLLALLLAVAAACAETTTLLVYMCGTDLQEDACQDLVEMAEVEAGDSINVVVLAGGAKEWLLDDLKANSRTLAVIRDGYFEELQDWGRGSMGDPDSLEQFLSFGLKEYPADRTIAVLWDHGAGSEGGVCFDETAGDDGLTIVEINEALEKLEKIVPDFHIDIFGCDACMMGTYEMAAMLAGHPVDFYVASEELEPGTGWNYTGWLEMLKDDPGISNEDLCGAIIDTFMEAGLANDPDDYLTLSAVRLSKVGELAKSMEQFASVMTGEIEGGNLSFIRRGRSRMYTFGSFDDGSWDMVDLGAVLDAYAQFDTAKAAEARKCLSEAVIASAQTDNLDTCCGLSILMPQDTAESFDEYREGFNLTGVIPNWVEFVNGYVSELVGGNYHFSASGTCQVGADTIDTQSMMSSYSSIYGGFLWDDEEECYEEEEGYSWWDDFSYDDDDQGFTAELSQEDLAYLDYVEGMLLMDMSDDEMECYVDFGTMQNNLVDWNTGTVVSLFDGTWPVFGGQPVPLYDQTSNDHSRRSLIPVKLNGEYTYLVVVFPANGTEGRIIGANAGYDDNGLPIRTTTRLKNGDEIIPVYTMYYEEDGKEDLQETEFEGDPIIWQDGMTVTYEDMGDEEEPTPMLFCFVFNDIFGDYTMSDMIAFEL